MLRAYHADVQEFLRETGYMPQNVEPASIGNQRKIPVVSWVLAGKWGAADETFQEEDAAEWIESDIKGEHNFALRVKGDSMEPEFNEGDIIISPLDKAMSGDLCCSEERRGRGDVQTVQEVRQYQNPPSA